MKKGLRVCRQIIPLVLSVLCCQVVYADDTVIHNVTLIDVEAGKAISGRSIHISDDKIVDVVDSALFDNPDGARLIQGNGLYLIPGLFDAHVHLTAGGEAFAKMCVAFGVTAVRDTGAATHVILEMREQAASGQTISPEIICTGAIIDGDPPIWPFSEACDTPEEARAAVRKLHKAGVDQIKVYSLLEPDVYRAAVDEAHKVGLKAIGHVPNNISLHEAMEAGQDGNEHLTGFDKLITHLADPSATHDAEKGFFDHFSGWLMYDKVSADALREFLAEFRQSNMMQCPTIVVMQGSVRMADDPDGNHPQLAYVPQSMRSFWKMGRHAHFAETTRRAVPHMISVVGELYRANIPLMVGTDLGNPYVFPGSSVHDEMQNFIDAGIPAADVLRMTTVVPAKFCNVDDRLGSVASGKTASLVLLRANPLDDIRNVAKIESVFLSGRYFDRTALDELKESVQQSVKGSTVSAAPTEKLTLPGKVVRRGQYAIKFQDMDSGVENFLVTKTDDGYAIKAHNQPTMSGFPASKTTMHSNSDFIVQTVEWTQLTDPPTYATYRRDGDSLIAEAKQGDADFEPQVLEVSKNAVFSPPVYAADFALYSSVNLNIGETKEFGAISFGYPSWKLTQSKFTLHRHDDVDFTTADGKSVRARRFTFTIGTPMGEFNGEAWTDDTNFTLKSIMKFPFGTIVNELQDASADTLQE